MAKVFASLVLFLLLGVPAEAQIIVRTRVPNVNQGCCGPATLESVARHQGYHQITGATSRYASKPWGPYDRINVGCGPYRTHPCHQSVSSLARIATNYGIPYQYRPEGSYDTTLIRRGLATGRPVIVSVTGEHRCQQGHFYAVVGGSSQSIYLYDTNQTGKPYVVMQRGKFGRLWDGSSILLGR